jgi:tetratricopeptide (TPR) repeat protein
MKNRSTQFANLAAKHLLLVATFATASAFNATQADQQGFRYNVKYRCGGENNVLVHCHSDSEWFGIPAPRPEDNYCQVNYPDGPKRNCFTAMSAEFRGDLVKKLPSCLALAASLSAAALLCAFAGTGVEDYLVQGMKYLDSKDYAKAIEAYKKAVALDPARSHAYYGLGLAYYHQKEYQLASSAYKQYVALKPDDARVFILLGMAYREAKQYPEAVEAFRNAIGLKPESKELANAYYHLGTTYVNLGKKEDALQVYQTLQAIDKAKSQELYTAINRPLANPAQPSRPVPTGAETYLAQGDKDFDAKDYVRAIESYQKATTSHLDSETLAEVHYMIGRCHSQLKQYEEAISAYRESLRLKPSIAVAHYALGMTYLEMGMRKEALQVYRTLESLDRAEAQKLYDEINKQTAATSETTGPSATGAESYMAQGKDFLEKKDFAKAIQAFKEAIALKPSLTDAYWYLAFVYSGQKQHQLAIEAFKQILVLTPHDAGVFLNLGVQQIELKQYQEALIALREALRLKPDFAEAHYRIGETYCDMEQYEKAISPLQQAVRLKPDYPDASNQLGVAYFNLKQFPNAAETFQQTVRLRPSDAQAHYNLGFTYVSMGKKDEALQVFRTLLKLDNKLAHDLFEEINKMK